MFEENERGFTVLDKRRVRIGLALGGGGARGLAHVGVLKVFQEEDILVSVIAGTSIGSLIGGFFSLCPDAHVLEKRILPLLKRQEVANLENFSPHFPPGTKKLTFPTRIASFLKELYIYNLQAARKSLMGTDGIYQLIKELIGESSFDRTKIPFVAVATDLEKGEEVPLHQGQMAEAILASCALPGVFPPLELRGRLLIDGGIVSAVPVEVTRRQGADMVIAVNLEREVMRREFRHGLDIMFQADDIRAHELNQLKLASADIVIEPEVEDIRWAQFSRARECIKKGEEAARVAMPELKNLISRTRRKLLIKRFFPFLDKKG